MYYAPSSRASTSAPGCTQCRSSAVAGATRFYLLKLPSSSCTRVTPETAQPDGSSCLDRCAFTRARTRHAVNAPLLRRRRNRAARALPLFFFLNILRYHNACTLLSNIRTLHLCPCLCSTTRIPPTVRHLRLQGNFGKSGLRGDDLPALQSLQVREPLCGDFALPLVASVSSLTALALVETPLPPHVVTLLRATHFPSLSDFGHLRDANSVLAHSEMWIEPFLNTHASQLTSLYCGWPQRDAPPEYVVRFPQLTRLKLGSAPRTSSAPPSYAAAPSSLKFMRAPRV